MRFALTADHRDFFLKNHFIAFEQMLSSEQVFGLRQDVEAVLALRLHLTPAQLAQKDSATLFRAGYDLWRDSEKVKKTVQKSAFALLAAELFQTPFLRYGFDQYVSGEPGTPSPLPAATLQERCCLSPLAGALLLPLQDMPAPLPSFPLPQKAGHGLFISSDLLIPWLELFSAQGLRVLFIVFAYEKTLFRAGTPDPHAAALKKLGYAFNEQLKDFLHPVLVRKSS